MKITVVGFAWGTAYKDEVQPWFDSVMAMNPPADEVVIGYHPDDDCGVKDLPCRLVECFERTPQGIYNTVIPTIESGLIAGLAMDDRFYPDAFSCLPPHDSYDVVANTIRFMSDGRVNPSAPNQMGVKPMVNHVMGTSWFTKEIWERVGGHPNVYWSDWAFWWMCWINNARWFMPPGVQVLVNDVRPNRISSEPNHEADHEMHKFIHATLDKIVK